MIGWIIGGVVVAIIVIWFISSYNGFVKMRNSTEEAFSSMDVFLKKRYDLIPNFVETVKGYAKHESETLEKVIAARNMAAGSKTMEDQIANENVFQSTLKSLFAVTEAYPDLKANTNFLKLQEQLTQIESEIEKSRRFYNAVVNKYNTMTEVFPSVIVASLFSFKRKPLYEVSDATQRENVKVQF